MEKIRIGIICPSEIAFRRFLPSLQQEEAFVYTGVAIADKSEWDGEVDDSVIKNEEAKAQSFVDTYGGKIFHGYMNMICSDEIDVVYLPLPPALHMRWAKVALAKASSTSGEYWSGYFTCVSPRSVTPSNSLDVRIRNGVSFYQSITLSRK